MNVQTGVRVWDKGPRLQQQLDLIALEGQGSARFSHQSVYSLAMEKQFLPVCCKTQTEKNKQQILRKMFLLTIQQRLCNDRWLYTVVFVASWQHIGLYTSFPVWYVFQWCLYYVCKELWLMKLLLTNLYFHIQTKSTFWFMVDKAKIIFLLFHGIRFFFSETMHWVSH